jgi:hypothetical protein
MEIHFYVLYALAAAGLALGAYLLTRIKHAIYLLEQPVVKKMSPQLNLKPIKIDQIDGDASRNQPRNGTPMNRNAGRPEGRDGHDRGPREGREGRESRERMPRGERDGEGGRGRDDRGPRGERAERGDRGDRGGRDRDRGGRDGHRHDRGERGDRGPRREFAGESREPAQAEARPAPMADVASPAPLAPRRPLPSTVDVEGEPKAAPAHAPVDEAGAADPFFGRDDSDIQHGRRTQMKKKPKFDVDEVEATEETKA